MHSVSQRRTLGKKHCPFKLPVEIIDEILSLEHCAAVTPVKL